MQVRPDELFAAYQTKKSSFGIRIPDYKQADLFKFNKKKLSLSEHREY